MFFQLAQTTRTGGLATLDWAIIAGYLLLLVVTGVLFSRAENKGTRDYFLGGRRMPVWAVAVSIIATSLSVATFTGAPQLSYAGNLTYLSTNLGGLIAVLVVAWYFVPAFYRGNCTTIYELLEQRFGTPSKHAASAAFMLGRVFASGARVFIAAIPLAMIAFGEKASSEPAALIAAIALLVGVAIAYTLVGGIASIIWTDVIQTIVMLVAVIACIVMLWHRIPASGSEVLAALSSGGQGGSSKLTVFRLGLDLSKPGLGFDASASFTILTAVFGIALLNIAAYGTDHDMTQRMLTCRSAVQGGRSVWISICIGVPVVTLFLGVGALLFIFYQRPDLMGPGAPGYAPDASQRVFLTFILREMPAGMSGLMIAGLFAVGIGSLNSAINAMAATFVKDFYTGFRPGLSERHYLRVGRWSVAGWGVVLGLFAVGCVFWQKSDGQTLIDLALGVMTFCYAGLLAVFATAIFTNRGNNASVIGALLTGFVVVAVMQFELWRPALGMLMGPGAPPATFRIAWPWHMTIGTAAALGVCLAGRRPGLPCAPSSGAKP